MLISPKPCEIEQFHRNFRPTGYLRNVLFAIFKKFQPSPENGGHFEFLPKMAKHNFIAKKYTYHFLTIAICWCHPTHWPMLRNVLTNLKRPVSECELACPPSGHVTTPVNNLHYFCWPSQSVDVFIFYLDLLRLMVFCLSSVVRHLCGQCLLRTKFKKHRGKVLLWPFYGGVSATFCKMAALMFRCWMKTIPLQNSIFSSKGLCYMRMSQVLLFFFNIFLSFRLKIYNNIH